MTNLIATKLFRILDLPMFFVVDTLAMLGILGGCDLAGHFQVIIKCF